MRNYNELDERGKFIRTIIFTVIWIPLWALFLVWVYRHFEVSYGASIKYVSATVICIVLNIWQIIKTYTDWKRY